MEVDEKPASCGSFFGAAGRGLFRGLLRDAVQVGGGCGVQVGAAAGGDPQAAVVVAALPRHLEGAVGVGGERWGMPGGYTEQIGAAAGLRLLPLPEVTHKLLLESLPCHATSKAPLGSGAKAGDVPAATP